MLPLFAITAAPHLRFGSLLLSITLVTLCNTADYPQVSLFRLSWPIQPAPQHAGLAFLNWVLSIYLHKQFSRFCKFSRIQHRHEEALTWCHVARVRGRQKGNYKKPSPQYLQVDFFLSPYIIFGIFSLLTFYIYYIINFEKSQNLTC